MAWTFKGGEPVFLQIVSRLRAEILSGAYPPNSQIPPVRQLALEASVNPNTVQKALSCLEDEGLLYSRGTLGRFVTSDTEILLTAREKMRRDTVRQLINDAHSLGISTPELIEYIKKEEDNNERSDTDM